MCIGEYFFLNHLVGCRLQFLKNCVCVGDGLWTVYCFNAGGRRLPGHVPCCSDLASSQCLRDIELLAQILLRGESLSHRWVVSLCENRQRQNRRAFTGLMSMQKLLVGDVPFYRKFWVKLTALELNRRFSIYFCP